MDKEEMRKKKRRLGELQKKMGKLGPMMRGSVVELGIKCGNAKCKCVKGEKHRKLYFSLNKDGKTKLLYLGKSRADKAKELSDNYKKQQQIVEEMTILCMELLKARAFDKGR